MKKKDKSQGDIQNQSQTMFTKQNDPELSMRLTQRLYACYTDSKMLIPNELITSVKNNTEGLTKREELTQRNNEKPAKLAHSMNKTQYHLASHGSIATPKFSLTGMSVLPPMAGKPSFALHTTRIGMKEKRVNKLRVPASQSLTSAEIRNLAGKELSSVQATARSKLQKEKGKLKPLKQSSKYTPLEGQVDHIELIRYIRETEGTEMERYYYCKRGKNFYEFFLCQFEGIVTDKDDYITVSSRGITHFVGKEAEFLTLIDWMDEVEFYKKINKIPFFKNFSIGKCYALWKKLVKGTKTIERGSFLSKELFEADTFINKPLIAIRKLLNNLENSDLLQLNKDQPKSLDRLASKVREEQQKLISIMKDKAITIKKIIFNACEEKIRDFNENAQITGKTEANKNDSASPYHIFADDTYHPMPYTVEASTKTLYKRLARFIRMVDYMLTQLKINIIKNTYRNLLAKLKSENTSNTAALFEIKAKYTNKELIFCPTVEDIKSMLGKSIADGIQMIYSIPPISDEEKLSIYMSTLDDSKEKSEIRYDPLRTLEESEDFKNIKQEIAEVLSSDFRDLTNYKNNLLPFIKIYEKHCAMDFNKLENELDQTYRDLVEEIDKDKIYIFDHLELSKTLGIIVLDCTEMKLFILKKPEESKRAIEEIIPTHAGKIVSSLMDVIKSVTEGIVNAKREPINTWPIDDYVSYKKFLEDHRRKAEDYEEQLMKAKALHLIMTDFRMKLTNRHRKDLDTMESKWKGLKDRFKQAYEGCESAEISQKNALTKQIPEIRESLNAILVELDDEKLYKETSAPEAMVETLAKINEKIKHAECLCKKAEDNEAYFQMTKDRFEEKDVLTLKYEHLSKFWIDQVFWKENMEGWYESPVSKIDTKTVTERINKMKQTSKEVEEVMKTNFELNFDYAKEFQEKKLEPMLSAINVVNNIMKDTVEKRHWDMIAARISCGYNRDDPEFTFEALMDMLEEAKKDKKEEGKSEDKIEEWIEFITGQAKHEYQLEKDFEKIRLKWDVHLTTVQIDKRIMVQDLDLIFNNLNQCTINLDKILANKYAAPLREKVEQLYRNIAKIHEILEEIQVIEKKMKLVDEMLTREEFKSHTFSNNRYDEVQKSWRRHLKKVGTGTEAGKDTLSQRFLAGDGKDLAIYQDLNKKMDEIVIEMETKLEDKQLEFPPLMFISCQEFLRILQESDKAQILNKCLQKSFPSVREMITVGDTDEIYPIGVISKEGEVFETNGRAKKISDPGEAVLKSIEELLKKDLKARVKTYFSDYTTEKKSRIDLAVSSLAQVTMIGEAIIFTSNTEVVIDEEEGFEDNMETYFNEQCLAYSEAGRLLTQSEFTSMAIKQPIALDDVKKLSLSNLIIQYIHYRDVVDFLIRNNVHGVNNFDWQTQLRHYLNVENIVVRQLNAAFEYGYGYLGVQICSPITPIVERCWVSFTSALYSKYWVTIAGAENHGKLSAVRDLAIALGKFFYSYSCCEETSIHILEKLFIGAVGSSSWVILENANALTYDVLSAFANTLTTVRKMICEDNTEWILNNGKTLYLLPKFPLPANNSPYFGIFMLVDNNRKANFPYAIKNMFRPIAITSFDIKESAEAWLCSFGFKESDVLGPKLEAFINSAKNMLSNEGVDSDFGVRTLYCIIKIAAEMRLRQPDSKPENQILVAAIRSLFSSRLPKSSIESIENLSRIVFQSGAVEDLQISNTRITAEIVDKTLKTMEIEYETDITAKIIELDNVLDKQSSCILIGNAASGKTKLLELLVNCYKCEPISEDCEMFTIFPEAFTLSTLYGHFDGKDWIEGILANNLRKLVKQEHKVGFSLLHCDGPLEVSWAEPLYYTLKSQKKLMLGNGDFVPMEGRARIVFEVEEINNISPAMVAQSHVVYLSKENVSPKNIIDKWMKALNDKINGYNIIQPHLASATGLIYSGLDERDKIPKLREEKIQLSSNTVAISFCNLFEAIYFVLEAKIDRKNDFTDEKMKKLIAKIVVFCLAWAFGGSLTRIKLKKIDDFIEEGANIGDKPKENSCFDVFLRMREGFAEYAVWTELAPLFRNLEAEAPLNPETPFEYTPSKAFTQIIVPTKQLLQYKWFTEALASSGKNVLLFGESGCGKSLIATHSFIGNTEEFLSGEGKLPARARSECKKINMCFTWHTNVEKLQVNLEDRLVKKRKTLYSAPTFTQAVVLIDDVNLPKKEKSSNVLEYLREIAEKQEYFDNTKYFKKKLLKTAFVCTASPERGGFGKMSERLLRHFNVFYMNTTGYANIRELVDTVTTGHFADFPREYSVAKSGYLELIMDSYDSILQRLPSTPRNAHYSISYKDIGKLLSGMLLGKKENFASTSAFGRLLVYECSRVFADKLISQHDVNVFTEEMNKLIEKHLSPKWTMEETELLFSSLSSAETGQYKEVLDWTELQKRLEEEQAKDESGKLSAMSLFLFKEAIQYVAKIARILIMPRAHFINIGSETMGRQALIALTTKIYNCHFYTMAYNMRNFNNAHQDIYNDIKLLVDGIKTGKSEVKGCVLFAKVGESIEDCSTIPENTYGSNTVAVMDSLYQIAATGNLKHVGIDVDVRDHLHIILATPGKMSDVKTKMKMYPGLFSDSYIIYQEEWPLEAFANITAKQLRGEVDESLTEATAQCIVKMHNIVEEEAVNAWINEKQKAVIMPNQRREVPRVFLEIFNKNKEKLKVIIKRLEKALENAGLTEKMEKQYQNENEQKKPESEKKKRETDEAYLKCQKME